MSGSSTDRIEKRLELNAPIGRVWRAISDFKEFGAWFRVNLEGPFTPRATVRGRLAYPGFEHLIMDEKHSTACRRQPVEKPRKLAQHAQLFAALGDKVRLDLLTRLSDGRSCSITQLAAGSAITRQAITKHLRVLQDAGIVRRSRQGRESLFQLDPKPLQDARESLDVISRQWDDALARLKSFVESD